MTSSLRVERELDAEPIAVWRALTEPEELAAWFWPPRLESEVEADARVGGLYRIASAPADMAVGGEYQVVDLAEQLAFTWQWDGEPERTVVVIRLAASDAGTRLTLMHGGFSTDEARDEHVQGWEDCLERLPAHLAR